MSKLIELMIVDPVVATLIFTCIMILYFKAIKAIEKNYVHKEVPETVVIHPTRFETRSERRPIQMSYNRDAYANLYTRRTAGGWARNDYTLQTSRA